MGKIALIVIGLFAIVAGGLVIESLRNVEEWHVLEAR